MKPRQSGAANTGPEFFREHGYAPLGPVISSADAQRYAAYALMKRQHPHYYEQEPQSPALSRYGDVMGESLLRNLQRKIEVQTGLRLLPSHSILRISLAGARLAPHTDESAREISALLSLGGHGSGEWPVWFKKGAEDKSIDIAPRELLVYRGAQLEHWREQLDAEARLELALHYVTADGDFINYRFDGRRGLGEPQNRKQQDQYIALRKQFDAALAGGDDRPCFCQQGRRYSACHGLMQQTLTA